MSHTETEIIIFQTFKILGGKLTREIRNLVVRKINPTDTLPN